MDESSLLRGLSPEDQEKIKAQAKEMMQAHASAFSAALGFAEHGDFVGLVQFVENEPKALSQRDQQGRTLLQMACFGGSTDVVKFLVERGADLGEVDLNKRTLLHVAAFGNRVSVAEFLILKGADVNALDGSKSTALHWATKKGHSEMVGLLVDRGASLNCQTEEGWSALHLACQEQQTIVAQLLVSRGADVNLTDKSGSTPLRLSVNNCNIQLMHFFLERSASGINQEIKSMTMVDLACVRKYPDAIETLAKFGARITLRVLKLSLSEGNLNLLKLCIEKKLPVQIDALYLVCKKGSLELAKVIFLRLFL
jgi:ankyrin repeat protein